VVRGWVGRCSRYASALAAVGVATSMALACPSFAAGVPPATVLPAEHPTAEQPPPLVQPLRGAPTSNPTEYSYNWSGYVASDSTAFDAVESRYVQPAITCPAKPKTLTYTVFWVGLDGWFSETVEQDGTGAICGEKGGAPSYFVWWEMYPTNDIQPEFSISPGDHIRAVVEFEPSGETYVMTVYDLTSKKQFTQTAKCAAGLSCLRNSAEWIVERPGTGNGFTNLADWGALPLELDKAAVKEHGTKPAYKALGTFENTPVDMIDTKKKTMASVGPISSKKAFTDTWVATE
jgi:hypothetical protein